MTKRNQVSQKNLNKKNFYFLCIVLIVLIINFIFILNYNVKNRPPKLLAHSDIDTKFIFGESPGIAVESEYIFFGRVTPGGNSEKMITIHSFDEPVLVNIYYSGNISDHVVVDKNNFILYPANKSVNLTFTLKNLLNLSYGNYTGKVNLDYYEVKD